MVLLIQELPFVNTSAKDNLVAGCLPNSKINLLVSQSVRISGIREIRGCFMNDLG